MAKYTIELRKICDMYGRNEVENWFKSYNLNDFLTQEQINQIQKYNVWNKDKLAKLIVDHYYMREIGFETPSLFCHYAKVTMNEIMESKLLKIYTKFLEYDPLSSVDYIEQYTREINGEQNYEENRNDNSSSNSSGKSTSNSQNSSEGLNINNDTPQTNITKQNLDSGVYASSINQSETKTNIEDETNTLNESEINNTSEITNSGKSKTTETYTHTMKGDNGVIVTNQYLIREFRELAININQEIIEELNKLFMGLY